jgi:hypothetical protein
MKGNAWAEWQFSICMSAGCNAAYLKRHTYMICTISSNNLRKIISKSEINKRYIWPELCFLEHSLIPFWCVYICSSLCSLDWCEGIVVLQTRELICTINKMCEYFNGTLSKVIKKQKMLCAYFPPLQLSIQCSLQRTSKWPVNLIERPDNRRLQRHLPNDLPTRFLV